MLQKLEAINGISIPCLSRVTVIDKTFHQLARLTVGMLSIFDNKSSSELTTLSQNTQYLQYEVFHLEGEVNIKNSSLMKKQLLKALLNKKSIILDFTNLEFIDSSGIATLIESLDITHASGLKLAIVGAKNLPLKMLELTKLDNVFSLFNSIQDIKI